VIDLLISGGPVMVPIGLSSVIALAVLLERVWALRLSRVSPVAYTVEVDELMSQGRWGDVCAVSRKSDCAAGRVLLAAVEVRHRPRAEIKERIEEVGRREAAELERFSGALGTIASIAPLLGLLGTVGGMILTFDVIQTEGIGVVSSLAGGISQALVLTMAGLTVGIPALVAHRWVLARADAHVLRLEDLGLMALAHMTDDGEPS
jgi:biopolymer transport protein ExbB